MSTALLLLSGGRSSRMGRDKASLTIDNMPLVNWQRRRFEASGFHVISGLQDRFDGYRGPLAGIEAALHFHPEITAWLVVPVDMPEVSPECLQNLIRAGQTAKAPACYLDCPLPLYLPVTDRLNSTLRQWLADDAGKRSVYALMHELDGLWLEPAGNEHTLFNINTPDQWRNYLKGAAAL